MDAFKDVHPILQSLRVFGENSSPVDEIAQQAAADLGLNSDEVDWFDFITGSSKMAEVLKEAEEYNLTEEGFLSTILAKLDESLPEPTAELRDNQFMVNNGYMTMIPYALESFRRELATYMKSRIFTLAEEKSDESASIPSSAIQTFGQALINRVQATAQMVHPTPVVFNQWVKMENKEYTLKEENAEEANKSISTINEQTTEAHKMFEEYTKFPQNEGKGGMLYETVIKPLKLYDDLRLNLSYYIHQEFQWQLLNAQIASEESYDEVLERIATVENIFRRLIDQDLTDVNLAHVCEYFVKMYQGFFSQEISDKKAELASNIMTQMIDQLHSEEKTEEALKMAKKAILKRVDLGSTNSKFIPKCLIDTPLYDEERPVISILRLFDALVEYEESQLEAYPDRINVLLEHIYLVLGFNNNFMLQNMVQARALFTQTLLSVEDNRMVFVRLYELVAMVVEKNSQNVMTPFAPLIDKNIDIFQTQMNQAENDGMAETYFAMKVQVANMARDEAWEMSFVTPFEAQFAAEIEYIQKDSSKWVLQAINRGLKNLGVQIYKSTPIDQRVNSLIEKAPFTSDKIKIIKRLLI